MQFAIIVYESQKDFETRQHPEASQAYWGAYFAYSNALEAAGVARGGAGLQGPDMATTLSLKDGKRLVQDGPYADTKEQLGGFFIIEAASLDAAMEWAAKCPGVTNGKIEVRPLMPPPPGR